MSERIRPDQETAKPVEWPNMRIGGWLLSGGGALRYNKTSTDVDFYSLILRPRLDSRSAMRLLEVEESLKDKVRIGFIKRVTKALPWVRVTANKYSNVGKLAFDDGYERIAQVTQGKVLLSHGAKIVSGEDAGIDGYCVELTRGEFVNGDRVASTLFTTSHDLHLLDKKISQQIARNPQDQKAFRKIVEPYFSVSSSSYEI